MRCRHVGNAAPRNCQGGLIAPPLAGSLSPPSAVRSYPSDGRPSAAPCGLLAEPSLPAVPAVHARRANTAIHFRFPASQHLLVAPLGAGSRAATKWHGLRGARFSHERGLPSPHATGPGHAPRPAPRTCCGLKVRAPGNALPRLAHGQALSSERGSKRAEIP